MKLCIFVCVVLEASLASDPQVYEDVDDQMHVESNTRVVRQPLSQAKTRVYTPPVFHFQETVQQDQRQSRYAQQQQMDMQNILRKNIRSPRLPLQQNYNSNGTVSNIVQQPSTKKPITSRKLKPSSFYEDDADKIKRQDNNKVVYINPQNRRSEYNFNALNALVGQDPNNQLEGLKRLLQAPQTNFVLPVLKGPLPRPIVEKIEDIPNPNTHPNIDTSLSIENIQSQLDEAAKAQLAQAVADAQKQALAQVEAQHRAIKQAQIDAQKEALAQIALHNQKFKTVQPAHLYAPTHDHKNVVKTPSKPTLKKISITKTHSVKQGHQSPNAYQQVVLETQQRSQKVSPGVNHLSIEDVGAQQYAARYAFGYKIRDVKMGNEFGHEEKRDGENARGLYHVLLPDGRMQKVEYFADPSGYHAKVTYENLAHH